MTNLSVSALNVTGSIGGVAQSVGNLSKLLGGGSGWTPALLKASWGDKSFAVESTRTIGGRRYAIHEYPYREDAAWLEDVGKLPARLEISGYLVEDSLIYGGGPVIQQRKNLFDLIETSGPQTLVHPTFGTWPNMLCINAQFSDERESGRVIEIRLTFMKAGLRIFPSTETDTGEKIKVVAELQGIDAIINFVQTTATSVLRFAAAVQSSISMAVGWYQFAVSVINDAKAIVGAVSTLVGNFGRLFGGANNGYAGGSNPQASPAQTPQDLLAAMSAARATVVTAGTALVAAAANPSDAATLGAAAQALVVAVAATAIDPADAVNLLSAMAQFSPAAVNPTSASAVIMQTMQDAISALFRRTALAQLAQTLTTYQPSSQNDAQTVLRQVVAIFDAEITIAGDAGDDESYQALRATRQAIIADLSARGGDLAVIAKFTFQAALPSLALAERIYRDATREPGLVQQAAPRHPAFCPLSFNALAT
jgi:prophage DNA circulation protein